ncbi:MAG: hypothetical protein ACUVTL_07695 [Thermoproteota archaeon]
MINAVDFVIEILSIIVGVVIADLIGYVIKEKISSRRSVERIS